MYKKGELDYVIQVHFRRSPSNLPDCRVLIRDSSSGADSGKEPEVVIASGRCYEAVHTRPSRLGCTVHHQHENGAKDAGDLKKSVGVDVDVDNALRLV